MMRRLARTLLGAWMLLTAMVPAHASGAQRVISLLPSLTETVCALGACERLVGVDRYSSWPASVRALPQLGGGIDPQIEAIVSLQPDLVLVAASSRATVRLKALGFPVLVLEPQRRADLDHVVHAIADALELDGANALLADIDRGVAQAAHSVPAQARGQRVYFEVSPAPYAAGADSFIGEVLRALGLDNIIGPELGPFPRINPELVVRAQPDLIMISQNGRADMLRRPGWAAMRALREDRVCEFDAEQRNIMVRPGPRLPEAARLMAACVTRVWERQEPGT